MSQDQKDTHYNFALARLNKEHHEPIKVMALGGWADLKTMQRYIRKAGTEIKGITDNLDLD